MTMLYPNLCYNEECYRGTILRRNYRKMTIIWLFKKQICAQSDLMLYISLAGDQSLK